MKKGATTSNKQQTKVLMKSLKDTKKFRSEGLNEDFAKTPQYCLIYTSMINQSQMQHMAIKTNDLSLKIKCQNDLLLLCFTTNRVDYAGYHTY